MIGQVSSEAVFPLHAAFFTRSSTRIPAAASILTSASRLSLSIFPRSKSFSRGCVIPKRSANFSDEQTSGRPPLAPYNDVAILLLVLARIPDLASRHGVHAFERVFTECDFRRVSVYPT